MYGICYLYFLHDYCKVTAWLLGEKCMVIILIVYTKILLMIVWAAAVAQWVRPFVTQAEGWVFESQPLQVIKAQLANARQ